jgi:restriction system protein
MFGAFLTVFQVSRNDAENRVLAILSGKKSEITTPLLPADDQVDIASVADDQIRKLIAQKFAGHKLAELVGEILRARGYAVKISPEGPDGGVDILAGSGKLGFEAPRIAVQVKSGSVLVDSPTVHQLQGAMKNFDATNGLIVSWGGFNSSALKEEKKLFFTVKMWNSDDLISNLIDVYEKLPEAVKTEIPMKKIWALMPEEE